MFCQIVAEIFLKIFLFNVVWVLRGNGLLRSPCFTYVQDVAFLLWLAKCLCWVLAYVLRHREMAITCDEIAIFAELRKFL